MSNFQKVTKAVIPVAGLGTRFLPATKAMPKEMLTVVSKPLIQYAVEEALEAGIREFVFVTGRGKSAIENHFDKPYELSDTLAKKNKVKELEMVEHILPKDAKIYYTRQGEPKGLGHAVMCAAGITRDEPFAVLLPDVVVCTGEENPTKRAVELYNQHGKSVVVANEVPMNRVNQYGIMDLGGVPLQNGMGEVKGFVEKPKPDVAPSNLAILGRYVLTARHMELLKDTKPGAGNEIQLTDAIDAVCKEEGVLASVFGGKQFDCGDKVGFQMANLYFALQDEYIAPLLAPYVKDMASKL